MILKSLQILKKDVLGLMKVKVTMTIQTSAEGRWGTITHGEAGAAETHAAPGRRNDGVYPP